MEHAAGILKSAFRFVGGLAQAGAIFTLTISLPVIGNAQGSRFGGLADPTTGAPVSSSPAFAGNDIAKASLPSVLDNRALVGPVKDQWYCGSCVVFANHALVEAAIVREYGSAGARPDNSTLSEQLTIDCLANSYPNLCDTGSHIGTVLDAMAGFGTTSTAIPLVAQTARYQPQAAACSGWVSRLQASLTTYPFRPLARAKYAVGTVNELKALVQAYGAATTSLFWTNRQTTGPTGSFSFLPCTSPNNPDCGGHALTVLGWDDAKQGFLVRNSWGTGWGTAGYGWISYSELSPTSESRFGYRDGGFHVIEGRVFYPLNWRPGAPDPAQFTLGVSKTGIGTGTVSSNVGGVNCGSTCLTRLPKNSAVTLTATPAPGNTFVRWVGGCANPSSQSCSTTMDSPKTIFAEFTGAVAGIEPQLTAVLGTSLAATLAAAPVVTAAYSAIPNVYASTTQIDRLIVTPDAPDILIDPSFSVGPSISSGGQYNDSANVSKMAVRIKRLTIDYDWLTSGNPVKVVFKSPSYVAAELHGSAGTAGATGGWGGKADPGQQGAPGGNGMPGANGAPGLTRQHKQLHLIVDRLVDPVGRDIPLGKVAIEYRFPGPDGGRGGNGGTGGNGGQGGDGGDGRYDFFGGCTTSPGSGGRGGTAGNGGNGGNGGDAGFGADVYAIAGIGGISSFSTFFGNLNPGAPGLGGLVGLPGQPGAGGARGAHPGSCGGSSAGPTGGVATQNSLNGAPGRVGSIGIFESMALTPAPASSASVPIAHELDRTNLLPGSKLTRLDDTSATISWEQSPVNKTLIVETQEFGAQEFSEKARLNSAGGASEILVAGLTPGKAYSVRIRDATVGSPLTATEISFVTTGTIVEQIDPTSDDDGDSIPYAVELAEGRDPSVKDNAIFTGMHANSNRWFAMQQYRDFLAREGDAVGITAWTNFLGNASASRAQATRGFFDSAEFQNAFAPLARLYLSYFNRYPDYAGLNGWVQARKNGQGLDTISQSFASSAEFTLRYGSVSNDQFVTLAYQNVLGRAPDTAGYNHWLNLLTTNQMTRGQVMLGFSESQEFRNSSYNEVAVTMAYVGLLRRSPDPVGYLSWLSGLDGGSSVTALLAGFIDSQEYRNRFLP